MWFLLFWFPVTLPAFYAGADITTFITAIMHPTIVYLLAALMGIVLANIGNYPRLFDYFHPARSAEEHGIRFFDRRRVVWEGSLLAGSIWLLYVGVLLLQGFYNGDCIAATPVVATGIGWLCVALAIVGLIVIALVTLLIDEGTKLDRYFMLKYVIAAAALIGLTAIVNNVVYQYTPETTYYGLIAAAVNLCLWLLLWPWIVYVPFYGEKQAQDLLKTPDPNNPSIMGDADDQIAAILKADHLDRFNVRTRVTVYVLSAAFYNVLGFLAIWLTAIYTANDVSYASIATLIWTGLCILLVVTLRVVSTLYHSARPAAARI